MDDVLKTDLLEYDTFEYKPKHNIWNTQSMQIVEVDVTLKDLIPYWTNKPNKLILSKKDYMPYTYENPYENLEYYCEYNYLFVGLEVIKSLLNGRSRKLLIGVFGYKNGLTLPPFIKGLKEYTVPQFEYDIDIIYYRTMLKSTFYKTKVDLKIPFTIISKTQF